MKGGVVNEKKEQVKTITLTFAVPLSRLEPINQDDKSKNAAQLNSSKEKFFKLTQLIKLGQSRIYLIRLIS